MQIPGPDPRPAQLETLGARQAGSGLLMPDKAETHRPISCDTAALGPGTAGGKGTALSRRITINII